MGARVMALQRNSRHATVPQFPSLHKAFQLAAFVTLDLSIDLARRSASVRFANHRISQ
jgi:hypothetical protein